MGEAVRELRVGPLPMAIYYQGEGNVGAARRHGTGGQEQWDGDRVIRRPFWPNPRIGGSDPMS